MVILTLPGALPEANVLGLGVILNLSWRYYEIIQDTKIIQRGASSSHESPPGCWGHIVLKMGVESNSSFMIGYSLVIEIMMN